ncbi:hypothetical protein [Nocardioides nitrophenolicus]|uniref:hypothetical protein n=1 Tax=Nocardioides nitrophenolicus TaxID=60489 RepID=UPI001EF94107|nr:hypothetical protein [Nocardioides nitrophenolicus]MBM7515433.1 hypothetical protein [Nocardioides nitrophenolicus]
MTTTTEDRFATLARSAMADVHADEALLGSVLRTARRRSHRRRAAYAGGGLALAAALGATMAVAGGADPAADDPGPAADTTAPVTLRLPTPEELDQRLAVVLEGGSTTRHGTQTPGRVEVERGYDRGIVAALAYDSTEVYGAAVDAAEMCEPVLAGGNDGPTRCTVTDDGWAISMAGKPDALVPDPRTRFARVTYFRRDGLVIDLTATGSGAPPLSRDRLVDLATTGDWFPAS